jgi:hypothetical protein
VYVHGFRSPLGAVGVESFEAGLTAADEDGWTEGAMAADGDGWTEGAMDATDRPEIEGASAELGAPETVGDESALGDACVLSAAMEDFETSSVAAVGLDLGFVGSLPGATAAVDPSSPGVVTVAVPLAGDPAPGSAPGPAPLAPVPVSPVGATASPFSKLCAAPRGVRRARTPTRRRTDTMSLPRLVDGVDVEKGDRETSVGCREWGGGAIGDE